MINATQHITSNENGQEEISIEYESTFLQWLFGRDGTKETYVKVANRWRDKKRGWLAGVSKEIEICDIIQRMDDRAYIRGK